MTPRLAHDTPADRANTSPPARRNAQTRVAAASGMIAYVPRYFVRPWNESRGDRFDGWGTSEWFFETDDHGTVTRQLELYANGTRLKYDASRPEDEYGALSTVLLDFEEFAPYTTTRDAFEQRWQEQ